MCVREREIDRQTDRDRDTERDRDREAETDRQTDRNGAGEEERKAFSVLCYCDDQSLSPALTVLSTVDSVTYGCLGGSL